jgi:hypothetical protein
MKKTLPKLVIVEIIHDDGFTYHLNCRELFDAMIIDKSKYPDKTATYLVKSETAEVEMTESPRLAQHKVHKCVYGDNYTNADARH